MLHPILGARRGRPHARHGFRASDQADCGGTSHAPVFSRFLHRLRLGPSHFSIFSSPSEEEIRKEDKYASVIFCFIPAVACVVPYVEVDVSHKLIVRRQSLGAWISHLSSLILDTSLIPPKSYYYLVQRIVGIQEKLTVVLLLGKDFWLRPIKRFYMEKNGFSASSPVSAGRTAS